MTSLTRLGVILTDRGSKYAVSGAPVRTRTDVDAVLQDLKSDKAYAKATHNTWAAILPTGALKADDGESGAGMVILRMLERAGLDGHVVVVTRWYGGKKLGGDRFRRVQDATRTYLDHVGAGL
ncbi:YigZ family protein [Ruegeria profundi]|uniref:YigZ family protein n=1 Tax=Ruegeria profundi TaxID=1685378 RepID=UPI001CD6A0FD|nr:YigZ family protein [Ruegeria profundi]MCA0929112.1 YigZ family protein [Ruegeria profundi]